MNVLKSLILSTALYSSNSFALTGNELLALCEGTKTDMPKDAQFGMCVGYSTALIAMDFEMSGAGISQRRICQPSTSTFDQTRKIIIKGLNNRPQDLHSGAALWVTMLLAEAYPC